VALIGDPRNNENLTIPPKSADQPFLMEIDWKFFFDFDTGGKLPQPSYRLDTSLVEPLFDLRIPKVIGPHEKHISLAERNLFRGRSMALPSRDLTESGCNSSREAECSPVSLVRRSNAKDEFSTHVRLLKARSHPCNGQLARFRFPDVGTPSEEPRRVLRPGTHRKLPARRKHANHRVALHFERVMRLACSVAYFRVNQVNGLAQNVRGTAKALLPKFVA